KIPEKEKKEEKITDPRADTKIHKKIEVEAEEILPSEPLEPRPVAKRRKPHVTPKRVLLTCLIIFTLFILKTGLDFYLGIASLQAAQKAVTSGDLKKAAEKSTSAKNSLKAAVSKSNVLLWPAKVLFPKKIEN